MPTRRSWMKLAAVAIVAGWLGLTTGVSPSAAAEK